jgi:hypothetical protein
MVAVEAKVGMLKMVISSQASGENLQIPCPLFFETAWHRFPEAICITLSRSDSLGQWGKRGQHFGLFLDDTYVCDFMCKMGGCVEYK